MYQIRPPGPALRRHIEYYWFVTTDDGQPVDLRVEVFVDARADLIFNFGAPYEREVIGGRAVRHRDSNVDAQRLTPIRIRQRGLVRISGVRFRLGGLGAFARPALDAFTDKTPPPEQVLGPDVLALEAALRTEADLDAQARLLDAFFAAAITSEAGYEAVGRALSVLDTSDGKATVPEAAKAAAVSSRQLDRLFARHVGIPPKTIGRVLRFQSSLRALMRDPGCALSHVATAAGYFDQAHFIKDFKRMSGGVPRGYRGYYPETAPTDFAPNVVVFLQDGQGRSA